MSIRIVKAACILSYNERTSLEKKLGDRIALPIVHFESMHDDPWFSMDDHNKKNHHALYYFSSDEVTHKNRVVAIEADHNVRIMSDVWASITYAVVYEPGKPEGLGADSHPYNRRSMFRRIAIASSDTYPIGTFQRIRAEIDAPGWLLEVYKAYDRGREYARRLNEYDARQNEIQEKRRQILKGAKVRVVSGRKVPIGTEGLVFWVGESSWGLKVGIAIPDENGNFRMETYKSRNRRGITFSGKRYRDVMWTYTRNVKVISDWGGRIL